WDILRVFPGGESVTSITTRESGFGLVFGGDAGRVARTDDGGETWRYGTLPIRLRILCSDFIDASRGVALGVRTVGPLLKRENRLAVVLTDNGGSSWKVIYESDS